MPDVLDFREKVQQIAALVQEIDAMGDPAVRARAKELVQALMDLHGEALRRAMEIVSAAGEHGTSLFHEFARDPLVSCVLVLYGLHPEGLDQRVLQAIERVKPALRKHGCEVEPLELSDGLVTLRVQLGNHMCGSTAATVRATLEGAIYEAAPDIGGLVIEGLEGKTAAAFVALDKLVPRQEAVGDAKAAD